MRIGVNLIAGFSYSAWSAIASLAAVPWLIHYLGVEAYGLIGFYASAQGVLYILDMGLAPAVNREVARNLAAGRAADSATLLRTLAPWYWFTALIIGIAFYLVSPFLAQSWLNFEQLLPAEASKSVALLGLVIACRWPAAVYQSSLMGAGRLTTTSAIGIIAVTLANAGGVFVVALVANTIEAFFLWQLLCSIAYTQMMRMAAWKVIGHRRLARRDFGIIARIWRFSAGMTGVAITAVLLMQLDKLILSKLLPMEDFGRYVLASLLASGLYVVLTPTFNTIYPRFSALVASNDQQQLRSSYRTGTRLLCCVLFPIAVSGALFSREVLVLWTGDAHLAGQVAPVLSVMLLGTALNGAMHFPYALQLAMGVSWLPLVTNIVLLAFFVPAVVFLTSEIGLIGGAAAWLAMNAAYLLVGSLVTHRLLMPGIALSWLALDVSLPFVLSLVVLEPASRVIYSGAYSPAVVVTFAAMLTLVAMAVCLLALLPQQSRHLINRGFQWIACSLSFT